VWKNLGSPELVPSIITICVYDDHPSQHEGLFQNIPIEIESKTIMIDVEFVYTQLDYIILLGCIYMYSIKVVT